MGSMAGFLSHRVLAGFDVGLPVEGAPPTFVVPNVAAFTADHGLDARQARLWLALHEATHRAELALPWVRRHLAGLVAAFVDGLRPDPVGPAGAPRGPAGPRAPPGPARGSLGAQRPGRRAGVGAGAGAASRPSWPCSRATPSGWWAAPPPASSPRRPGCARPSTAAAPSPRPGSRCCSACWASTCSTTATAAAPPSARRWPGAGATTPWPASGTGPEGLPTPAEIDDPVGWAARVLL